MKSKLLAGLLLSGILWVPTLALAQGTTAAASTGAAGASAGRLAVVDIKDATLKDALNLIFDSAGIKSRSIDASADDVNVPDVVRSNIAWDDLVRSLCLTYNYRITRNGDLYVIEPRAPIASATPGGFPGGPPAGAFPRGFPGAPPAGAFPNAGGRGNTGNTGNNRGGVGAAPANPFGFGGATQGDTRNRGNGLMVPAVAPDVETRSNSQTTPRGGRNRNNNARGNNTPTEPLRYSIVPIRHVYSGGIARLFNGGQIVYTRSFVTSNLTSSSGSNGTGGGIGGTGGTSGIGGTSGGIGGSIGGGGFGGSTGGFGGGF